MKRAALILCAALLSGCATIDLSNRVACTVAKDRAVVVSMWGRIGVASTLDARDARAVCR